MPHIADDIAKMQTILKERGRTTSKFLDPDTGKCCLLGAYCLATGFSPEQLSDEDDGSNDETEATSAWSVVKTADTVGFLAGYLQGSGRPSSYEEQEVEVYGFNDYYRTTDQEVLDVLAEAETVARAAGV